MADSRAEILRRIRIALADRPVPPPIPRDYDHTRDVGDVLELFLERVADYRAVVHRIAPGDLVDKLTSLLSGRSIVAPDVPSSWLVPGVSWLRDPLSVAELDASDGVLTGCAVGIAETGTIVLDGGVAQGRRALTLLPDYHLCVVEASQVVGTVPEGVARLDPLRPLTFISGPSATSDIELNRVEGVHGPRTLEVLLVAP